MKDHFLIKKTAVGVEPTLLKFGISFGISFNLVIKVIRLNRSATLSNILITKGMKGSLVWMQKKLILLLLATLFWFSS
jgi:hypothetical protein